MTDLLHPYKMDKTVLTVATLPDESDERAFWASRTPHERLQALEYMRQVSYGYDPAVTRLQRILTVTQLGAD